MPVAAISTSDEVDFVSCSGNRQDHITSHRPKLIRHFEAASTSMSGIVPRFKLRPPVARFSVVVGDIVSQKRGLPIMKKAVGIMHSHQVPRPSQCEE